MLYVLIKFNLFNIIRLIKNNIEVYLKNINKLFFIVINNEIIEYINIKKNLYYLRIINYFVLLLNFENLYILFIIN